MSEQTTPRTVEEAAREEAERRWPMTDQEREMVSFGVRYAQQAARMPSVEEVVEVLAAHAGGVLTNGCCECGVYVSQDYARRWDALRKHRAEWVVALWGGGERG